MKPELNGNIATGPLSGPVGAVRDSNMEALRIVAMSMILFVHIFTHAITHRSIGNLYYLWYPVLSCGVDIFFLISGWFGIRWSWRGITRLLLIMGLFNVINILGCYLLQIPLAPAKAIEILLFPIGHEGGYWFMQVYLLLMVTAPIVSRGLDTLEKHPMRMFMLIFSVVNFYSCWLGHNQCNLTGYSYIQALYLYCLARWLRKDDLLYRHLPQWSCPAGFFAITILLGLAGYRWPEVFHYEFYNSLPIVVASVFLLIYFSRLRFRSRFVNAVAAASLGCYLLQDGLIGESLLYKTMHEWWKTLPLWETLLLFAAVYVLLWTASYLVTRLISIILKVCFKRNKSPLY